MKPKWIVSGVLLAFVGFAVAHAVNRQIREQNSEAPQPTATAAMVAYYFHTTARCTSCKTIEAYSREAIQQEFAGDLQSGKLDWKTVNVDQPENRHFISDYQLSSMALVLVETREGKPGRWKNLDEVWQLLGDKEAFLKYVRTEVRQWLKG